MRNKDQTLRYDAALMTLPGTTISGYRAASGILGEMNQYPTFSIAAEDEKRARLSFETEIASSESQE